MTGRSGLSHGGRHLYIGAVALLVSQGARTGERGTGQGPCARFRSMYLSRRLLSRVPVAAGASTAGARRCGRHQAAKAPSAKAVVANEHKMTKAPSAKAVAANERKMEGSLVWYNSDSELGMVKGADSRKYLVRKQPAEMIPRMTKGTACLFHPFRTKNSKKWVAKGLEMLTFVGPKRRVDHILEAIASQPASAAPPSANDKRRAKRLPPTAAFTDRADALSHSTLIDAVSRWVIAEEPCRRAPRIHIHTHIHTHILIDAVSRWVIAEESCRRAPRIHTHIHTHTYMQARTARRTRALTSARRGRSLRASRPDADGPRAALITPYFLLPTPYFLLPTPHFLLPSSVLPIRVPRHAPRASTPCCAKRCKRCSWRRWRALLGASTASSLRFLHPTSCNSTSYVLHPTSYTLHPAFYILRPTSYILRPASYILHHASYVLRPTSHTSTPLTSHILHPILHPTSYILQGGP